MRKTPYNNYCSVCKACAFGSASICKPGPERARLDAGRSKRSTRLAYECLCIGSTCLSHKWGRAWTLPSADYIIMFFFSSRQSEDVRFLCRVRFSSSFPESQYSLLPVSSFRFLLIYSHQLDSWDAQESLPFLLPPTDVFSNIATTGFPNSC